MKTFFTIIDLLLPITFILMLPLSKYCIKLGINNILGFRTKKSMLNDKNWEKANYIFGKYFLILGILSLILTIIFKILSPLSMEINSLIIAYTNIALMLLLCVVINLKI